MGKTKPGKVGNKMEKPVKILAVGNSFSEDATFYLPQIAEAGGKSLILGRLYIGGCSLERHWTTSAPTNLFMNIITPAAPTLWLPSPTG